MGKPKTPHPIVGALFPLARTAVLSILFANPDRQFYFNEIARVANVGHGAVQRELQRLTRAELLTRSTRGNLVLYQANRASPIFPDILAIVNKTTGIAGVLREALTTLRHKIAAAFVYGSVARSSERSSSDIDLFIIGSVSLREVCSTLRTTQHALSREINPTVFAPADFSQRLQAGDAFLLRVLASPRLDVIGAVDDAGNVAA